MPRKNTITFYVQTDFQQFERKYLFSVTFRNQILIFVRYILACKEKHFMIEKKSSTPLISLKGTIVNWTRHPTNGGSLDITPTVPLSLW